MSIVPIGRKETEQITLATELRLLDQEAERIEARRDEIKESLMATLKKQGVRQVRLDDGTMYIRAERKSLIIKDPAKAMKWAREYECFAIDKSKALKIFTRLPMPRFFGKSITEYLTVRRYHGNETEEGD